MQSTPSLTSWVMLFFLGLIWGASFLGVTVALTGFGPLWVVALRIGLAAVLIVILSYILGPGLPNFRDTSGRRIWLHAFGFSIFSNALPFALLSWAQLRVTSGFAGITMAVVPLFILPMSHYILKDRMTPRKVFGFLMGFAGVIVLVGPERFGGMGDVWENIARLACVCASACYATGAIITRTTPPCPQLSFAAAGLTLATLMIVPIALIFEGPIPLGNGTAWTAAVFLGIFPTAVATVLLVAVIRQAGPAFLGLVNYQVPIWAVVFGLIFLAEALPASFVTALALILAGLAISQSGKRTTRAA